MITTLKIVDTALDIARSWWKALPGFAVGALLAFPLGQCSGKAEAERRAEANTAIARAEAALADSEAKEKSADERLNDAAKVADLRERLTDAVASLPDEVPSAHGVALGCQQLREAYHGAELPLACRSSGGGEAASAP